MYDPRVEPIGREVLPVLQEYVRLEGFEVRARLGDLVQQPKSPCQEPERESVSVGLVLPAGIHVSAPDYLGILAVDRDGGMVGAAKMCTVARMIDIAVGQDDEAQVIGPATLSLIHISEPTRLGMISYA